MLSLVRSGHTSKEIGYRLGISMAAVHTDRVNLMKKLHIRNVACVVVFAFRAGLIKLGSLPR